MDPIRFDLLSRNLASRASRRGLMRGASAGTMAGLLSLALGRGRTIAAAPQKPNKPVTCSWNIEAQGSVGPNVGHVWNGILTVVIETNGRIDKGSYTLVDALWQPLLDSNGDPIVWDVVGSTHHRSIDFRVEHDGCTQLAFTGVNRDLVWTCHGPMSGSFEGPALVDLGGWRTERDDFICPACEGLICAPGEVVDYDSCTCVPTCPGGKDACGRRICPPDACPPGTVWDEKLCNCVCEPVDCEPGSVFCPITCTCVPPTPCQALDCPKDTIPVLTADGICVCKPICPDPEGPCNPPCPDLTCPAEELLIIVEGGICYCVPSTCEQIEPCPDGYVWSDRACKCLPQCIGVACGADETFDPVACACIPNACTPRPCEVPKIWDEKSCACVCPAGSCATGGPIDPVTCECAGGCVEQNCDGNYKWDPDACACVCPDIICDLGYALVRDMCECLPCADVIVCDPGYILDDVKCACYPDPCVDPGCDQGFSFNPRSCQCEEGCAWASCTDGFVLNNLCQCECRGLICKNFCTDQYSDPFNCGDCGIECPVDQICYNAQCMPPVT